MPLSIDLLGTPQIEVDGAPLSVDTRKAVALLAFLAVRGGTHGRDLLAELLWPEADRDRSRSALRRTLSTLRAALGGHFIALDRSAVALDVPDDAIDVRRFRALARGGGIAALEAAVALHRGDLLAGFGLRDSVAFDDWQREAAVELRTELEAALDRLAGELSGAGRAGEAIPHAQRRLALDPLHEPAHRSLIRLYAATGHRAEALHQYRECVRVLDRELGVRPLPETSELYAAVSDGRPLPGAPPAPPAPPAPAPRAALVGRDPEWAILAAVYGRCSEAGRLVVLEGEAGVGKTRLGEEFLAHVATQGGRVIEARSHEGEAGLPFGLAAAVLRAAVESTGGDLPPTVPAHWRAEAARLVPEIAAGTPPAAEGPTALQRLHEGIAQVLGAVLDGDPPSALLLDDLHYADAASLALVAYLTRRLMGRRLLITAAWRPEDAGPELAVVRRTADAVIRLGRLDHDGVAALAAAAGAQADAERLFAETDGLPLFVVEYLAAIGSQESGVPGGVRSLLASRLDRVGEAATQLLTTAAVIGRSFDVSTLRSASGRSEEETVVGIEELTTRGLIVEREPGYEFSHDRLLDLVYARTSLARRRLLHRRVAAALETAHDDPALIARHLQAAGLDPEAAAAYRRAGDRARALHASSEALDAYRSALALGHPDQAALHENVGDQLTLQGEYRAALAAYEAAAALADDAALAGIEHKLGRVHDRRGEPDLAERHLAEASRLGGASARVQADRSLAAHRAGRDGDAGEYARSALELAQGAGDTEAIAQSRNILGMLAGDAAQLEQAVEMAELLPDRSVLIAALNNLALACARAGDGERAIALTERALALCATQGDRHREAALGNNLADLLHAAGREADAMEHLKRAVAIFAEIGADGDELQPEVWKLVEW